MRMLLVFVVVVWPSSVVSAQAPTPQEIIKKAIDAHGGADVLNRYPAATSSMKGVLIVGPTEIPFSGSLAFAIPGKVRFVIRAESKGLAMTIEQIVNGDKVIQLENGKPTPLSDKLRKELQHSPALQEMSLLTPLLDEKKYTLKPAETIKVNDKVAYGVIVKSENRKEVTLYFDAESGLLVKMSRLALNPAAQEVIEESLFSDYQKVAGMVVPMKLVVNHDGRPFMNITVSDYKPLERIDEKQFEIKE